jgi:predicted kinase
VIAKDDLKEVLFDELGVGDRAWSARLGAVSVRLLLEVAERLVRAGVSVVVDANLDTDRSAAEVEALRTRVEFRLVELHLTVAPATLSARMRSRVRHPGHPDDAFADEVDAGLHDGRWRPLANADACVELDTTTWDERAVADALAAVLRGCRKAGAPDPDGGAL